MDWEIEDLIRTTELDLTFKKSVNYWNWKESISKKIFFLPCLGNWKGLFLSCVYSKLSWCKWTNEYLNVHVSNHPLHQSSRSIRNYLFKNLERKKLLWQWQIVLFISIPWNFIIFWSRIFFQLDVLPNIFERFLASEDFYVQ